MKSEPPASLLKLAAIFVPATLGAFLAVVGMLWLLVYLASSLSKAWWDGELRWLSEH
jgi:hypothetical protein